MKKASTKVFKIIRFFIFLVAIIFQQGCGIKNEKTDIQFEFVDPLEKVLAEASYFLPSEVISEVVRGEHATLQFIVRSQETITDLEVRVSEATNAANALPPAKVGFVGYVEVGRTIPNLDKPEPKRKNA